MAMVAAARLRRRLAAPFSSRAPPDPRREAEVVSPQAWGILCILESGSTRAAVCEVLEAWPCRLTPRIVKEVLHKLRDGSQAATFFDWAATRPGFNHDALTKCELLLALLRTGRHREAYGQAALLGCVPNRFIFQGLVSAFAMAGDLRSAKELLRESRYNRIGLNVKVLNSLLRDLVQLGRLDDGVRFFKELVRLQYGNVYSVTIVVQGLCDAGRLDEAEALVLDMTGKRSLVNEFTYRSLVSGLCKAGKMDKAFTIVSWMVDRGLEPGIVAYNMLLHGLCSSQKLGEAEELMKVMVDKGYVLDTVSYTVMIDALCKKLDHSAAFEYFHRMFNAGCIPDVVTYTAMAHGLTKAGKQREAMWVLNDMLARGRMPNSVTCNAIIDGLCKVHLVDQALATKVDMERKGFAPDRLTYNCLIDGYGKVERMADAWHVFREMVRRGIEPCNVTWSSLLGGLSGKGKAFKAWKLIQEMRAGGFAPDTVTYSAVVSGLAKAAKLETAAAIVEEVKQRSAGGECKPSVVTYNSLINGLCRAGKLDEAFEAMDEMRRHGCQPDVISFNTIIGGLVRQRRMDEAVMLAKEMSSFKGCSPNLVTRTAIIHGFCSAGRLAEAIEAMSGGGSGITLGAVITGLGKAGLRLQARAILEEGLMLVDILVAQGRLDDAARLMKATDAGGDGNLATFMTLLHSLCNDEATVDAAFGLLWNMRGIYDRAPGRLAFDAMARSLYGVTSVGKARKLLNDARRQLRLTSS